MLINDKLQRLMVEKTERNKNNKNILDEAFPQQREFILDPSRRKAALVARRSGKSYMIGIYLIYTALSKANLKCLYFCKTQDTARNVMWLHIIFNLLDKYKIAHKYNKTKQEIEFVNGSLVKLTGADADEHQIEKVLGGKYKLVIFDECQIIRNDLKRWIEDRLGPAMIDEQGTICMLGTSGDYMGDDVFWYQTTRSTGSRTPGWTVYTWPWSANPHMQEKIAKELSELKSLNNNIEQTPGFRQEWLCEWIVETDARIYKYNQEKNALIDPLIIKSIQNRDKEWNFIIGLDFGFEDDTALVVGAFSKFDKNCYIVDCYKEKHLYMDEIGSLLSEWKAKYNPVYMVGDAQNLTIIETMRSRYRIPIVPAKKLGKEAHIASMNSDFIMSKIKVLESSCLPLVKEWNELTWNEKKRILGTFKENSSKDNHAADACLYLHYFSKHYRAIEKPIEDLSISPMRKQAEEELLNQKNQNYGLAIYDEMEKL